MTTEYTAMPRKDEYSMMWHPKITLPDRYGSIPRLIQSGGYPQSQLLQGLVFSRSEIRSAIS